MDHDRLHTFLLGLEDEHVPVAVPTLWTLLDGDALYLCMYIDADICTYTCSCISIYVWVFMYTYIYENTSVSISMRTYIILHKTIISLHVYSL